jgi:hypothetical protein
MNPTANPTSALEDWIALLINRSAVRNVSISSCECNSMSRVFCDTKGTTSHFTFVIDKNLNILLESLVLGVLRIVTKLHRSFTNLPAVEG